MSRLMMPAVLALLLLASGSPAQQSAVDLIPEDTSFAVVVKNIEELRKKGDTFFADNAIDENKAPRPTELFKQLYEFLKINKGIDEKGSGALVLPSLKALGIKEIKQDDFITLIKIAQSFVLVVPVANLDDMASNFDLKGEKLKPGEVYNVSSGHLIQVKGKHLYYNLGNQRALELVIDAKPITKQLSEAQVKALTGADALLHFGPEVWGPVYRALLDDLLKVMALNEGDQDNEVVKQFVDTLAQVRFAVGGLTIGKESSIDLVTSLKKGKDGAEALKFLTALRGGPGASDLEGLPDVDPLVLYAAKGDGERNAHLARALLKGLLDRWLGIKVFAAEEDRKKFLTAFEVMYRHLKGSRAVVYRTAPGRAKKVGETAAVAILDLDDVEAHRKNWQTLVEVANNSAPVITRQDRKSSPKFAFKPNAEKIAGREVDWLTVEIPDLDKAVRADYEKLMGPDWNKVRLAVEGKRVVGLFGSDVDALTETLDNLKAGKKGLAERKAVKSTLALLSPSRKVELHVNLANYRPLLEEGARAPAAKPVKELTSLALVVEEDRVQLQVRSAGEEIKEIVKLLGLAK